MGDEIELRQVGADHPDARKLLEALKAEQVALYGHADPAHGDPHDFVGTSGAFVIAYSAGRPIGCGGWRTYADHVAEVKKMYMQPSQRRCGIGARLLCRLEQLAAQAGAKQIILETGVRNHAVLRFYQRSGYTAIQSVAKYRT